MFVTKRELTIPLKGYDYVVPKGTALTTLCADGSHMEGEFFVEDLSWITSDFLRHDPTYYGLRVKPEDAEEIASTEVAPAKAPSMDVLNTIERETTNRINVSIKMKAQGIRAYRYSSMLNDMMLAHNGDTYLNPTMVWYMNDTQLAVMLAYLQHIGEIKAKQAQQISNLLEYIGIK